MPLSDRQKEIIIIATEIICKKGIQNLTMRNLADALDVTEPAIYRHFESKDDLMLKIAEFIVKNWNKVYADILNPDIPAKEELQLLLNSVVKYFVNNRYFSHTIFSFGSIVNNKKILNALGQIESLGRKDLVRILKRGQKEGSIRCDLSSAIIAEIILSTLEVAITRWILTDGDYDLENKWQINWKTLKDIIMI